MKERALFTWLHLSDIHAGHGQADHRWDQRLVMRALSRDIRTQHDKHPNVDAIFVTGDIAFSGGARDDHEYAMAAEWLGNVSRCTGVPNDRIFLVPGNHDVDRGVFLEQDQRVKYMLLALRNGHETLDAALDSPDTRAGLERRLARYLAFAGGYAPECGKLFWGRAVEAASGVRIRVVGLNTALLCQDDTDKGKLRLGKQQLALLPSSTEEDDEPLVIVLSHHPVRHGWLAPGEDEEAWAWIRQRGLYLCGREHNPAFDRWATGGGQDVLRVMSGSVHRDAGEPETHGYCWCCLLDVDGAAVLRYWPRVWSPENKDFRADVARTLPDQWFAQQPVAWRVPKGPVPPRSAAPPPPRREPDREYLVTVCQRVREILDGCQALSQALEDLASPGRKGDLAESLCDGDPREAIDEWLYPATEKCLRTALQQGTPFDETWEAAKVVAAWLSLFSVDGGWVEQVQTRGRGLEFEVAVQTAAGVEVVSSRFRQIRPRLTAKQGSPEVVGADAIEPPLFETGWDDDRALDALLLEIWARVFPLAPRSALSDADLRHLSVQLGACERKKTRHYYVLADRSRPLPQNRPGLYKKLLKRLETMTVILYSESPNAPGSLIVSDEYEFVGAIRQFLNLRNHLLGQAGA